MAEGVKEYTDAGGKDKQSPHLKASKASHSGKQRQSFRINKSKK